MTDKQIIIDNQKKTIHRLQDECTEKTNAILLLGQECNRLKEEVSLLKESNSKLQQIEDVNSLEKCYLQQLDQLKAENEELKKIIERLDVPKHEVIDIDIAVENEKLSQTLAEIKEVLQLYNNTTIGIDKGNGIFEFEVSNDNVLGGKLIYFYDTNPAKKALQKISECEAKNGI